MNLKKYVKGDIKKNALIFIHGNSLSSLSFQKQFDAITNIPMLAFDLPGHGLSVHSKEPNKTYCIPGYINALKQVVEENEMTDFILVGHSLGGHIALEATNEINGLKGIVIFGTPPIGVPPAMDKAFLPNATMGLLFQEHLHDEELKALSDSLMNDDNIKSLIIDEIKKSDGKARVSLAQSIGEGKHKDELQIVKNLNVPLLMLHAQNDSLINLQYLQGIESPMLWQNKLHLIESSGHSPQLEQPENFNKLIMNFYSSVFKSS